MRSPPLVWAGPRPRSSRGCNKDAELLVEKEILRKAAQYLARETGR